MDSKYQEINETSAKPDPETKSLFHRVLSQLQGKLLILLSALIMVSATSIVKFVKIPLGQYMIISPAIMFLFIMTYFFYVEKTINFRGNMKYFVFGMVTFNAIGGNLKFWAVKEMNFGDALAIISVIPIFAAIFSRILWKEKISIITIGCLFLGLTGVVLIARPGFIFKNAEKRDYHPAFPLVALSSALFAGLAYSFMRKVITINIFHS